MFTRLHFWHILLLLAASVAQSQQNETFLSLIDTIPYDAPTQLHLSIKKGYMAVERIAISNDGTHLYYGVRNGYDSISEAQILRISYEDSVWSKPTVEFPLKAGAPALSPGEKSLYFQFDHPTSPQGVYCVKSKTGWTTPKVFSHFTDESHYLLETKKNSFFYSGKIDNRDNVRDIYHATIVEKDTIINRLGFELKGNNCCTDFFVNRDESYIILSMFKNGNEKEYEFYGEVDLFISFKLPNNTWSIPINLGESINNLSDWTWGPYVTQNDEYLFFSSWADPVGTYVVRFDKTLKELKIQGTLQNNTSSFLSGTAYNKRLLSIQKQKTHQ